MYGIIHSTNENITLYGWLVAIPAFALSISLLMIGLGGDTATHEQENAVHFSLMGLGAAAIVGIIIGIPNECWWSGFAYAGVSITTGVTVYGTYAAVS